MKRIIFYSICIALAAGCKKNSSPEDYPASIQINIGNYDLQFQLKKVHNLTDSIYFEFTTVAQYDCNKYTINYSAQTVNNKLDITLGNIFKYDPFCIYGQFPAVSKYKSAKLANGTYGFFVKKGYATFEGTLEVTDYAYTIQWDHDLHCMEINPKVLIK
jgi:hypothetical protein